MKQIYIVSDYLHKVRAAYLDRKTAVESVKAISDPSYTVTTVPILDSTDSVVVPMDDYKGVEDAEL